MPDFDIDFCMDRRDEVIDYVARKYGRDHVSQIITYGSMAAKAVLRDSGRVLGMGYSQVDRIAKLIPARPLDLTLSMRVGPLGEGEERTRSRGQGILRAVRAGRGSANADRPCAEAGKPDPQRRQARRRRGDRADAAHRFRPAVLRSGRRRRGDPVRQGRRRSRRPGEVRLPRPAHADHHRLGGEGDQPAAREDGRSTARHLGTCRWTTPRRTSC